AAEARHLAVPLRPDDAAAAERALLRAERGAMDREKTILAHRTTIDLLVRPLFETMPHPPIEDLSILARNGAAAVAAG
nr:hypothetical protein [Rhodospirillales bacterium]